MTMSSERVITRSLARHLLHGVTLAALVVVAFGCGGGGQPPATDPGASPPPASAPPEAVGAGAGYRYLFRMLEPSNDNFAITDRTVYLWFWPDTARVNFRMQNRLGTPMKILWDSCRFRTTDGIQYPIIHRGITYEMRNRAMGFTQVMGLDNYSDWIAPNVLLENPSAASGGPLPLLFPTDALAMGFRGREFQVDFVLEIDGTPVTYRLLFTVDNVSPPQ